MIDARLQWLYRWTLKHKVEYITAEKKDDSKYHLYYRCNFSGCDKIHSGPVLGFIKEHFNRMKANLRALYGDALIYKLRLESRRNSDGSYNIRCYKHGIRQIRAGPLLVPNDRL